MEKCTLEGCEHVRDGARGYCRAHYDQIRLSGTDRPKCLLEICDLPAMSKGYCNPHYQLQFRATQIVKCSQIDNGIPCDKPARSRGICHTHYTRFKRSGTGMPPKTRVRPTVCTQEGCSNPPGGKNRLCWHHQAEKEKAKKPPKPPKLKCSGEGCEELSDSKGKCTRHYKYEYAQVNKEKIKASRGPEYRYKQATRRAEERGIPWNLTFEQYSHLLSLPCYYCEVLRQEIGTGLDRKNNDRGYDLENALPCCRYCNWFRSDQLTVDEAKALIVRLGQIRNGGVWKDEVQ